MFPAVSGPVVSGNFMTSASLRSFPAWLSLDRLSGVKKMSQLSTRAQAREQDSEKVLDEKAAAGETVVPGGKGGHTLAAQERLAAGRKAGGEARKHQIITEGYADMAKKANHTKHNDADHGTIPDTGG